MLNIRFKENSELNQSQIRLYESIDRYKYENKYEQIKGKYSKKLSDNSSLNSLEKSLYYIIH